MSRQRGAAILYWDASAVLAALLRERRTPEALRRSRTPGPHLLSSLGTAEVQAVLSRMHAGGVLDKAELRQVRAELHAGPWEAVHAVPAGDDLASLADNHTLRGADLWHLALAKMLQRELPELRLFTFDARLRGAAEAEGLVG